MVGYIAHCWELLGSWAWTPSLVTNALQAWQMEQMATGLIVACAVHLSGMFSTLIVGAISDYFNRASVLIFMGAAGALSSLLMGLSVSWGRGGHYCSRLWGVSSFLVIQASYLPRLPIMCLRQSWGV